MYVGPCATEPCKWAWHVQFTHRKGWGATTGPGMGGISMLLVERSEGLTTSKIKTSYSPAAGTAYVFYDNVKVPVGNLLGEENQGFRWERDAL